MDLHTPGDKTFGFGKLYKVRDAYASMVNESYQQTQQNKVFNYIVESIKVNDECLYGLLYGRCVYGLF